jgi:hypothetical protein
MVTPFYQDKHCTIYHGDMLDVLPGLGTFQTVIVPIRHTVRCGGL